jgi:putative ABC transport system substrate-binding protein
VRRRRLSAIVAAGLLWAAAAAPPQVLAQGAQRVYRVGILRPTAPPTSATDMIATGIPRALGELGYIEGRNLKIELRWAGGDASRLPALAEELARHDLDVVVAVSAPAVRAMSEAAPQLPIVMFGNTDPVALGLVASLARPGGNITGVLIAPDGTLAGKRLELLTMAVPNARRIAYLAPPASDATRLQLQETRRAAAVLGLELSDVEVIDGGYAQAFAAMAAQRPAALFVAAHTLFVRDRRQIIELAAKYKLPAIYEWREQVKDGGLMSYSTDRYGLYQRLADYVDRIVKGARPADLPVEQPTKFTLVINLGTARALGLTLPQSLLLRADELIQ